MREIKFRVRRDANIIGYERVADNGWAWMCPDLNPDSGERWVPGVIQTSQGLLQRDAFTGLKDKNGKDIYEGDIVRILYSDWPSGHDSTLSLEDYKKSISKRGLVSWYENTSSWSLIINSDKYGENGGYSIHPGPHGEIEVIGDIHRNPELLNP